MAYRVTGTWDLGCELQLLGIARIIDRRLGIVAHLRDMHHAAVDGRLAEGLEVLLV